MKPSARVCGSVLVFLFASALTAVAAELVPPAAGIKRDRPRLLLRPANTPYAVSLPQLKALPRDAEFQQMLRRIEGLKSHAAAQALVYHLTGQEEAAERALAAMQSWSGDKKAMNDPFHVYFTFLDKALAYDWLYDYPKFDAQAKAAVRQKLQPLAERGLELGNDHVFHNYVWMFNGGAMLWALATAGDDPAADQLLDALRKRFNGQLFPAMEYLEGANADSAGYWWLYCQHSATMVLLAAQSAFEMDAIGAVRRDHHDWLNRQFDYLVLSTLPDMRFIPWGDAVMGANGGVTHEMAAKIDGLTWALQSPAGAHLGRWLAEKRGLDRFYGETAMYYFLYTRHLAVKPAEPPPAVLAGGQKGAYFVARSDWSDGATVVGLRSTDYFGQHLHRDQGSFVIYRNGMLALDAGSYRRVGDTQVRTDAHNTLLLGGQGQRPESYQSAATLEAFTQRLPKGLETGDILFYQHAGDWTAVAGQFAQAYSPQVARSCVRQLLFVRPGTVAIVDHLAAPEGKSLPEVGWMLHVPGRPEVSAQAVTATNAKSYLRCRPLMPGCSQPKVEESYRTAAGPSSGGGSPAMTDASRVVFSYEGKPRLVLVHVLDVGDGKPAAAPDIKVEIDAEAVRLLLDGKKYSFSATAPFGVALALGNGELSAAAGQPGNAGMEIVVDGTKRHQAYEGFGATTLSLVHQGGHPGYGPAGDSLGPKLRRRALDALYGQVKLTMGNLSIGPLESPGGWNHRGNDNDDAKIIDWKGFDTFDADSMWNDVVKPFAATGLDNYSLQGNINWRWVSPWLADIYRKDKQRCLDECAEQVEACVACWRKIAGNVPRYVHLFNEPTSGNREIAGADAEMVRDIVKRAGDRLRSAGFKETKFVVPNEETVERSLAVAKVILEDPEARRYVAAVGYHVYPYGSPYASVPKILKASGSGKPDPASIEQRRRLRDLCRQYDVPAWMTEVSHAETDPRRFDHLRGRAVHIHDEMTYADASAFYGMNAMWDKKTHSAHFAGRGGEKPDALLTEEDTIVLADNDADSVLITGMGYAIGHYARWLHRGAVRLETRSADGLVLATAFQDEKANRLVLVIINNAPEERALSIELSGVKVAGQVTGEQSYGDKRWQPLEPFRAESPGRIKTIVPALSVTTLAAPPAEGTDPRDDASPWAIASGAEWSGDYPKFNPMLQEAGQELVLTQTPVFVGKLPDDLARQAQANLGKPYPWGGDYARAKVVTCRLGAANTEDGLKQVNPKTTVVVNGLADTCRRTDFADPALHGEGHYVYFRVDPLFVPYGTKELEITIVAKRVAPDKNAGMNLCYESAKGYRGAPGWWTIPEGDGWHQNTWKVSDANFVGQWGWNFRFDAVSSPNEFLVKEVRVKKSSPPAK